MRAKELIVEAGGVPVYYFAYGMLTDPKIMGDLELVGVGELQNFEFEMFNYANVLPNPGHTTYGCLWAIDRQTISRLDQIEGYPKLYDRKTVPVYVDGQKYAAEVYTMTPQTRDNLFDGQPTQGYVDKIVRGYRNAGVPIFQLKRALRVSGIANNNTEHYDQVDEVKASPHRLATASNQVQGALVGIEFEMLFPTDIDGEVLNSGEALDWYASEFARVMGVKVDTGHYHEYPASHTNWRAEFDGSIEGERPGQHGVGIEFISPPLPPAVAESVLKKVAGWGQSVGADTNSSTGLHMNVSVPGYSLDKLDYIKLALFYGDRHVLEMFDRLSNSYCASAISKITKRADAREDLVLKMFDTMRGQLNSLASRIVFQGDVKKYTSINTKDNRIEFRSPGGDWLNEDIGQLIAVMHRGVWALDIAMDPNAHTQEYAKKLYKLLGSGITKSDITDKVIATFANYATTPGDKRYVRALVTQIQNLQAQRTPRQPNQN
jgi:gamma-glutamylcyclotransferase (GGCT)/AIG2-like uncharacterized protein YtfP